MKFDGYLFLTDIDGTLTDSRGALSKENSEAIKYFQSEGGLFTVATGRFPEFIDGFSEYFVPNTYIVGINGTVLYDPAAKEDLISHTLDKDFYKIVIDIAGEYKDIERIDISLRNGSLNVKKPEFDRLPEIIGGGGIWYKVIFCQSAEHTLFIHDGMIQKYGDEYNIDCSWPCGIEIHSYVSGKGNMLREMTALLNKNGKHIVRTIAAGDFENDITMLRAADTGYAVANAISEVREAADRITVSNDESAIAAIIDELDREVK